MTWKRIPKTIGVLDRSTGKFIPDAPVTRVELYPPGSHPPSAIRKDVTLALIRTPYGTRQYGFADGCIDSSLRVRVKLLPGQERDEVVARWPNARGNCMSKLEQNPRRKLSKRCQRIVSRTAAREQRAGYPQAQAVAIGYSKARKAGCRVPPPPRRMLENPADFWGRYLG